MSVRSPRTLSEACSAAADHPDADLLAGGTDLMVEVNSGHRRAVGGQQRTPHECERRGDARSPSRRRVALAVRVIHD